MKKLLLLLLTLCGLSASAAVETTTIFDFTDPLSLNCQPQITQVQLGNISSAGVKLQITDRKITSGPLTISFSKTGSIGAAVYSDGSNFALQLGLGCDIKFDISGGCSLISVQFDMGNNLRLPEGQPGSWSARTWSAGDSRPTSVTLHNGTDYSTFYKITVKYNSPATPLNFQYSTPSDGSTVAAFNKLTLAFNTGVTKVNAAKQALLTGGSISGAIQMDATASGSTGTLTIDETISEAGNYQVSVPAGLFETSEGALNSAINVAFTIVPRRDTFSPTAVDPASGTSSGKLPKQIKMTFPSYVKTGTGTVKFYKGSAFMFSGTVAVSGTTATVSHSNDVTEVSAWKVEIPEKLFHNDLPTDDVDYRWNPKLTLNYTVDGSQYVAPEPVSVTPVASLSAAVIEKGGDELVLTIGNVKKALLNSEAAPVFRNSAGETVAFEGTILTRRSDTQFNVNTTGLAADSYTLVMPKGTFTYELGENEVIDDVELTADFEVQTDENTPQDSETMKAAKALLAQTGVGYPTADSPAYTALQTLVNSEEVPTDEALQTAIDALYNETQVALPEEGKWYRIAGVNATGKTLYLTFSEDKTKVGLGTSASGAAAFQVASVADGKVVFKTKEGFFLHVPMALPMHVGTSDANLTEEESSVNKLTLAKFLASAVEGADAKALYGKLTIFGSLGTVNGIEESAYALLNFDTQSISTYAGTPLTFSGQMSNAFVLTETTEPTDVMDYVYLNAGLRPDVVDKAGDDMTLVIYGPDETTVKDATKIYFTQEGEKVEYAEPVLTLSETANNFKVNTSRLQPGMYGIVMEEGAFDFKVPAGKTVKEVKLNVTFTIRAASTPATTVTPTAALSKSELEKAGEELVLTVGNVKKAVLSTEAKPVYKYADGENAGEAVAFSGTILTKKSDTEFYVNTTGLADGKYTLTLPKGTFSYELEEGQTLSDAELSVSFQITTSSETSGFKTDYDYTIIFMPALHNKEKFVLDDVDLNDMILYIYDYMGTNLVANPEVRVLVADQLGGIALTGHFENYYTFAQDFGSEFAGTYAIRFVPDVPLQKGDLDNHPGIYGYYCMEGAFGDENYRLWLNGNSSITPDMCSVNPARSIASFTVKNGFSSGISTVGAAQDGSAQRVYDLQGRPVTDMTAKGVYIVNGKKIVKK